MLKKLFKLSGFKISLVITLAFLAAYSYSFLGYGNVSFLELIDKQFVDFAVRYRGKTLNKTDVAVIAIDTKSIDAYGQWPWKRSKMAELLHELETYYQIRVMGYDVLFSEADSNDVTAEYVLDSYFKLAAQANKNSEDVISSLRKIRSEVASQVKGDAKFGAELSKWNNIVLGYFFYLESSRDQIRHLTQKELDEFASRIESSQITIIQGAEYLNSSPMYEGVAVEANIKLLNSRNNLNGFFNVIPDREDGTIRRIPLIIKYKDMYFPSLDLQIIRLFYGNQALQLKVNEGGIEGVKIGDKWINTASDGSVMINFRGEAFTFPHYSVFDVINHNVPVENLKNKVVLLGATETGIYDLRTTPFGTAFPGVEVHANLVDNMIKGDYFYRSDFTHFLTFIFILFFGLMVGLILPRLQALHGLIFSIAILIGYFAANLWFLYNERTWTSFVYVLGVILINWFGIVLFKFFGEEKDKRFIKGAFQQYLSPKVIDRLVDDPGMLKLGGEKRYITAFFSDVQGFSTISESLSPEELVELLNEYLTAMTDIIMKYDGTVDKFEGDAVIAFFGAPVSYENHASRACQASLEMQEKLVSMRKKWREDGRHELYVRIGLNTGEMVVGNMGSAYRMDYTMMGDAVNLASRLEGVNKEYGTYILISEFTNDEIKEHIVTREIDKIRVVGKTEPIGIYEVLGLKDAYSQEDLKPYQLFAKGLKLYRAQEFEEAMKYFAHCNKEKNGDKPSQIFFNRCKLYRKSPPGDGWDGVYQMLNK